MNSVISFKPWTSHAVTWRVVFMIAVLGCGALTAAAQDAAKKEVLPSLDELFKKPRTEEIETTGTRWALIISGHPGDAEHQAMYAEIVEQLRTGLMTRLGFDADHIRIQFGAMPVPEDTPAEEIGPVPDGARGTATSEEIAAEVQNLRAQIKPDDSLWTIVMGHAHWDGRHSYLNVPRDDIHEEDFAKLFEGLEARQQVFFVTTSVSGYFVRPLSAKGRIVITATEADLESNETLFPAALAEVVSNPPADEDLDADDDGAITLFDVYIAVVRNVARRYLGEELLATEHALLDDNGDGRGTELQLDYLNDEEGGRATADSKPPKIRPNSDGALAIATRLAFRTAAPASSEAQADTASAEDAR